MQVGRNPVFLVATAFSLINCHRNVKTFYFPVKNGCFWDFLYYIYSLRVVTLSSVTRENRVRKRVNPALTSDSVLGLEAFPDSTLMALQVPILPLSREKPVLPLELSLELLAS